MISRSQKNQLLGDTGTSQVPLVVKNLPVSSEGLRVTGSIPGPGRSPGGGHGNPLQSCLENPMGGGAWGLQSIGSHRVGLKQLSAHAHKIWKFRLWIFTKGSSLRNGVKNFLTEKQKTTGIPWWLSDKGSACQCRSRGFDPCSGKIPRASEQLSSCATTAEPVR